MSLAISVFKGQVVITLTLLLLKVVVVIIGIVVVRISAVAAAVVVVSSSQESVQTKEPCPHISLMRGLSLPSAAVAASAIASTKQSAQEPGVRLPVLCLSLASAAGIVVVVAAIQSSAENSA